jgi:membrane protease YdiL (CAAX protease family)
VQIICLLVVALIPAIGEEFLFRGALMRILGAWIKKPHLVVWITAFIFSAFHFQFYGFFPRLLLGAFLGYVYLYSGNIWVPITAHFLNNGLAVVMEYLSKNNVVQFNEEQMAALPLWIHGILSVAVVFILIRLKKRSQYHG